MIVINNLSKKYRNEYALKNINLKLPRTGLVAICGPSGCGKTTLLNCLSGILDYEGSIAIDVTKIENMSEEEKADYRLKNIGFIFQDFKLFDLETVERNILFPLDIISNARAKHKRRKCHDLIAIVGLKKHSHTLIKNLSGGEKQRVAIARAIVNDPKIVLADEPTGSLNIEKSYEIMDICKKISQKSLVVIVSHDEELMKKYADRIIYMKDGEIEEITYPNKASNQIYLPVYKNKKSNKRPSIPLSFLTRHTFNSIRARKIRTLICNIVTSLSLIGVGLASSLSSIISLSIGSMCESLIGDSKLLVTRKNNANLANGISSGSFIEASSVQKRYQDDILDVGVDYIYDFETNFVDKNCLVFSDLAFYTVLDEISIRHVNEFRWLDDNHPPIYPRDFTELDDDEVILSLTIGMINEICWNLRIERTVTSLSNYLEENNLYFYFDLANYSWGYEDQQIINVKGFTLETEPGIYHSNHLWNEYMLEDRMRFPTSDSITNVDYYPWILKKIYYFYVYDKAEKFLEKAAFDEELDSYTLEIANHNYFPLLYRNKDIIESKRILFFFNNDNDIPLRYSSYFVDNYPYLNKPLYGNNGSYYVYPSDMIVGFAKQLFLSGSKEKIEEMVNTSSSLSTDDNEKIALIDGVKCGHYLRSEDVVKFSPLINRYVVGEAPKGLNDIVISKGLYKSLYDDQAFVGQDLYIAFNNIEKILGNGKIYRNYIDKTLHVTGVIDSQDLYIYHRPYWIIGYFQCYFGVSAFNLKVNSLSFNSTDTELMKNNIKNMKVAFPGFDISNPLDGINSSVDEVCYYLEIALSVFSSLCVVIAILILSVCNYLHILESKKDIGIARCIGARKNESKKFIYIHSGLMCLISFAFSAVELSIVTIFLSFALKEVMGGEMIVSFNVNSYLYMFILSAGISLFSSLFIAHKITKITPLDVLKK